MTTVVKPGEVLKKKFEYEIGPNGQMIIAGTEEYLRGTVPDPPEELERRAIAMERRVVAAVQKSADAIASQAVLAAAPKIAITATLAAINALLRTLPEPVEDISATDYRKGLMQLEARLLNGKVHVCDDHADHKSE